MALPSSSASRGPRAAVGGAFVLLAAAACLAIGAAPARAQSEPAWDGHRGWILHALELQHRLADDVGMTRAPWVGTHNSYNSVAEMGPALSALDQNQRMTIVDQLNEGVRSLELDVHRFINAEEGEGLRGPVVCHALPQHIPCTIEKGLARTLQPIATWLADPRNRRQVLLIYLEDHLGDERGYDLGARVVERVLGEVIYRPPPGRCTELPRRLTRNDVRRAGARVVIVSDCGQGLAWPGVAFHWDSHREARPTGFTDYPHCGPDFTREDYDSRLIRYYEDSTFFTAGASLLGAAERDEGITPPTAAAMARCGVELTGLDQLERGDPRLEALVWSWAPGQPGPRACAVQRVDRRHTFGRWIARRCSLARRPACLDGRRWRVLSKRVRAGRAAQACERRGAVHSVPRTGFEAQELRVEMRRAARRFDVPQVREVWLGQRRAGDRWRTLDRR